MPERPRSDRLLRDELEVLQHRALRTWVESDWLAEHDPETWRALEHAERGQVCVSLGYAEPGCIVVGGEVHPGYGEADFLWSGAPPFEDATVDVLYVRGADVATQKPPYLARVLRVGGSVVVRPPVPSAVAAAMTAAGFDEEELRADGKRVFRLTRGKQSLEQAAPLLVDEHVMGERIIRPPRTPSRR